MKQFLYHYTTIETLSLILKSRNIRFNKLSCTDDLEESQTKDMGIAGQYVFVSCWTSSKIENIPLWYMYSKNLTGVRIGLPFLPFKDLAPEMIQNGLLKNSPGLKGEFNSLPTKVFIPDELIRGDKFVTVAQFTNNSTIDDIKVNYTDESELLLPNIFEVIGDKIIFKFGLVGKYKRTCWSFQNEYRYRIIAFPIGFNEITQRIENPENFANGIRRITNQVKLDFEHIYLSLDDDSFSQMEIVLGPEVSDIQRENIKDLVLALNPKAEILDSQLKGKIKTR